ncbi:MAG: hypothetical protein VCC68_13645 [Myxococcota bacterium]
MAARRPARGYASLVRGIAAGGLAIAVLLAGLAATGDERGLPADWQGFESTTGRFRAMFPGVPVESSNSRRTLVGRLTGYRYEVDRGETFFMIETRDLPTMARFFLPKASLVEKAADGLLEHAAGAVLENTAGKSGAFESRAIRYRVPGEATSMRLALVVLVEKRLYLVIAGGPDTPAFTALAADFIGSFDYWQ